MKTQHLYLTLIAAGFLCFEACASSPPPVRRPDPVSDPAATAARISGDWQFAMERGGQAIEGWLHFSLSAGEMVGSLTGSGNNPREISRIVLKGDKISWQIENDFAKETYEGKLSGSSMEGTLKVSRKSGQGRQRGSEGDEGSGGSRGGGGFGGRRGGRGGGGGRGGATGQVTWRAFRSVQPALAPAPEPTKRVPSSWSSVLSP
jgi:hypothetical protein